MVVDCFVNGGRTPIVVRSMRQYTKANSWSAVHFALVGMEFICEEDGVGDECFLGDFRGVVKNDIYRKV